MKNFYDDLTWNKMLSMYPVTTDFDKAAYYKILSADFPDFLEKYLETPAMQRLKGIGLLCGTDFTKLYKNRFYYSRFDHSIGVALIVWHFTHDKTQTLSGLFHDISTPVFSHSAEFRKGDALNQTDSESETENFIRNDSKIMEYLKADEISLSEVSDYHIYPVCDNERPQLSADRLEYMFPSGAALQGSWKLSEIKSVYDDISILRNEKNIPEPGFNSIEQAEIYTEKFLETGHILQLNENKLCLELLGKVTQLAIDLGAITEESCYKLSENEVMQRFSEIRDENFHKFFTTYIRMTEVLHSDSPVNDSFCVNLKVKQRYINPLVKTEKGARRISEVSEKARRLLNDFLSWSDTKFGAVKFIQLK